MSDVTVIERATPLAQPPAPMFGSRSDAPHFGAMNVGAVSIEQERAIAEAQGQLILAKRFPRSVAGSTAEFLDACKSPEFASAAFYAVPNRGNGPSIRFAEEAARCYGNFQYGHRELSRSEGKSEIEVYAWDMEKNNRSTRQITVMHIRDKQGTSGVPLKDQTDIDNRIANVASKQVRGRILALLPKGMVEAGKAEAKKTLSGGNTRPVSQRIIDMTGAFAPYGVSPALLEGHLGHALDQTTIDELADLSGIYNALKEGAKPSEYFGADAQAEKEEPAALTAIQDAGKAATADTKKAAAPKAADKPKDAPAEKVAEKVADKPAEKPQEQAQEPAKAADAPAAEKPAEEAQAAAEPAATAAVESESPEPATAAAAQAAPAPAEVVQPAAAADAAPAAAGLPKEAVF